MGKEHKDVSRKTGKVSKDRKKKGLLLQIEKNFTNHVIAIITDLKKQSANSITFYALHQACNQN